MSDNESERYLKRNPIDSSFSGGSEYVAQVCTDGMLRVVDRLDLERRNVGVQNVPIGGTNGIGDLFEIFRKARQGFRLVSRVDNQLEGFDPSKFLRVVGVSREDQAAAFISGMFPEKRIINPDDQFALSVFFSFAGTLQRLVQAESVNFYSLGITPTNDPDMVLSGSNWRYNFNQEFLWRMIGEMESIVMGAVFSRGFYGNNPKLFQAAHFLAANLSLKMNKN